MRVVSDQDHDGRILLCQPTLHLLGQSIPIQVFVVEHLRPGHTAPNG
jgi:hypothetical protein